MHTLSYLLEDLAQRLVYQEAAAPFEGYAYDSKSKLIFGSFKDHIYGIAQTGTLAEPMFELYHQADYDLPFLQPVLARYSPQVPIKAVQSTEFQAYLLEVGSKIALHDSERTGSLGGIAWDLTEKQWVILSNNHVLAACNEASQGSTIVHQASKQAIGALERFCPLKLPPERNRVDAAIGRIHEQWLPQDGQTWQASMGQAQIGERVYKQGATTGLTYGKIVSLNSALRVNYGALGILNFEDSLVIRGENGKVFSKPGDSGSLVKNERGEIVGLLYAGDHSGKLSFANSIQEVCQALNIAFEK